MADSIPNTTAVICSSLVGSTFNASMIAGIISMIATNNNGLFVLIMISINS